jgi:hypothetical protein
MKAPKILLSLFLAGSILIVLGQEKQRVVSKDTSADNPYKSKIAAVNNFKLPYAVEVFSGNERDQKNRAVVNGLTVKGAIVSAAVSSVGSMAGNSVGAATASYARVKVTISQPESGDEATTYTDEKGNFTLILAHDTLHTIYVNGVEYGQVKLKTKHDTVKNSINNVR